MYGLFNVVVLEKLFILWGLSVTTMEDNLLSALRELLEASLNMTSGKLPSADDMERYNRAIEWSNRVIELAEKSK
jgi:hypothetical protein